MDDVVKMLCVCWVGSFTNLAQSLTRHLLFLFVCDVCVCGGGGGGGGRKCFMDGFKHFVFTLAQGFDTLIHNVRKGDI